METVYRDYGAMALADSADELIAPENRFNIDRRRQVYQATHRGDGSRLPFMNRSFISFTYGGKPIENWDLIATIVNNRIDRDASAAFNDIVTTYDILDGQFYWGTHYQTNSMQFVLSTDGIDQKTLDDFLHWFRAGEAKELILSEHPNRAIMARVANPPKISLLPFEYSTNVIISEYSYPVKTTLYKGDITLEMIMDEPHWYAINNILGKIVDVQVGDKIEKRYDNFWDDTTYDPPREVDIFKSQDALKILYEDGIPLGSMIEDNMLLGNGSYASMSSTAESKIWSLRDEDIIWTNGEPSGTGARVAGIVGEITYIGYIAGPKIDVNGNGIVSLSQGQEGYFYYSGTAPAPTIISFTITPTFDYTGYFNSITNSFISMAGSFNTITIESVNKEELKFTTPNILTSYNKAVKILSEGYVANADAVALAKKINNEVHHAGVREWALAYINNAEIINSTPDPQVFHDKMISFFKDSTGKIVPINFSFNSKTGAAIGHFTYRKPDSALSFFSNSQDYNQFHVITSTEDVGDMLLSNNIILRDRNYPTETGKVVRWTQTPEGRKCSHRIIHDLSVPLENLQVQYRNMYL